MSFWSSIRFRISVSCAAFVILVLVLGLLGVRQLSLVNNASSDIRDRWLQSTQVIGDLNNYTSDYRAAEASYLLSFDKDKAEYLERDLHSLTTEIALSQLHYLDITHDRTELEIYDQFAAAWRTYQSEATRAIALSKNADSSLAVSLYLSRSKQAYDLASDTLGLLTKRTVQNAAAASERAARAYAAARSLVMASLVAAVVVVGLSLLYISRAIVTPLLVMASRMRALAANDTSIDIEGVDRRDEIGVMARAIVVFRNNAVQLDRSQNILSRQAQRLRESLDNERRLTTLQRNFVSMASHEFRTPLTVIDGQAQRLISMSARLQPGQIEDRAGRVRRAVQRMTHVIDNLLDSSRLFDNEAGLDVRRIHVSLPQLIREVCQLHREISPAADIAEDLGNAPEHVVGDPKLLFQALSNLVSNAVKYSPEGGTILVRAMRDEDVTTIDVTDHGMGIPAADMPKLFQRYHRGANAGGIVGTGVGLYLVKMVATLHGGDVTCASREGEGSCFTVHLPAPRAGIDKLTASG